MTGRPSTQKRGEKFRLHQFYLAMSLSDILWRMKTKLRSALLVSFAHFRADCWFLRTSKFIVCSTISQSVTKATFQGLWCVQDRTKENENRVDRKQIKMSCNASPIGDALIIAALFAWSNSYTELKIESLTVPFPMGGKRFPNQSPGKAEGSEHVVRGRRGATTNCNKYNFSIFKHRQSSYSLSKGTINFQNSMD